MIDKKKECEDEMIEEYMVINPAYRQLANESRDHGRPDIIREMNERAVHIRARFERAAPRDPDAP